MYFHNQSEKEADRKWGRVCIVSCRRFVRTGRCPLVFIVSDSLSGDASSRLLFPKDLQEELSIRSIRFAFQHVKPLWVELKVKHQPVLCWSIVDVNRSLLLFPHVYSCVRSSLVFFRPSSFNPVAPTSMMKVLSRIATVEASKVTVNKHPVDSFLHLLSHFHACFHSPGFRL